MTRKDFLQTAGKGAFFALVAGTVCGCAKENLGVSQPPENIDVTLDLNEPANAALLNKGG
jgi:hypothetical protein